MKILLYIIYIILITNLSASATDENRKQFEKDDEKALNFTQRLVEGEMH